VEFSPIMSSIQPWVARSQLKLYLFPNKSMYPSECFARSGPIEVEGKKVLVVEKIVDDRKKNQCHQFLVHWKEHLAHEVTWEPLTHLTRS
jgi:hypothetical protein